MTGLFVKAEKRVRFLVAGFLNCDDAIMSDDEAEDETNGPSVVVVVVGDEEDDAKGISKSQDPPSWELSNKFGASPHAVGPSATSASMMT